MNTLPGQNEILGLEQKYWQAMKNNDVEAAIALTRFPCLVTGPSGTNKITEAEYRKMMKSHPMDKFSDVEINNPQVEYLNKDTAVITYSTEMHGMEMLDVSTWIREGAEWLCAFHSENPKMSETKLS